MEKHPERYVLKIDLRRFFHNGVIPEYFKYPRPAGTTAEAWKNKTPDDYDGEDW